MYTYIYIYTHTHYNIHMIQGFQGCGLRLSTNRFEILREMYGLRRYVCFYFFESGPLNSIF